jgi:mannan endo-1,4-beta-mannosidase
MITRISLVWIVFCIISFGCSNQVEKKGFSIKGSDLLDANGNKFIIQGVNNPHVWYPKKAYNALETIASLNVNTVRIVWQIDGKVELLDSIMDKCIQLRMIPMVELHDVTGDSTTQGLLRMAEYYVKPEVKQVLDKYSEFVLLNIANEWGDHTVTSEKWKSSYMQAIDILRKAGYKITLVIDAPGWGQNIEPILKYANDLQEFDPQNNLLFSIHMYGSWNDDGLIQKNLQMAFDKNIPLIVGEFGYNFLEGQNNLGCKVDHLAVLEKCAQLEYGILPWSWTGNSGGNEWLDLVDASDWETLTWWGEQVFDGQLGIKNNSKKASVF